MKSTININYHKGNGFVRLSVMGTSVDVLGSVWAAFVTTQQLADHRGKAGQITMPQETLVAMLEDSGNVTGNKRSIQAINESLFTVEGVTQA